MKSNSLKQNKSAATSKIKRAWRSSLICTFFRYLSTIEERAQEGRIAHFFRKFGFRRRVVRPFVSKFSHEISQSLILSRLAKLEKSLLSITLRVYGVLFFAFGFFAMMISAFDYFNTNDMLFSVNNIFPGAIIILVAAPLIFFGTKSLSVALCTSKFACAVLFRGLGLEREHFAITATNNAGGTRAFAIGTLLGVLTVFIPTSTIFLVAAILIATRIFLRQPESGVILTLFLVPFFNLGITTTVIYSFILITTASFILKFLRGKRNIKFHLIDIAAFLLMTLSFVHHTSSSESSWAALIVHVCFFLIYWLIANMICDNIWMLRAVKAVILSLVFYTLHALVYLFYYTLPENTYALQIISTIAEDGIFAPDNFASGYFMVAIPFVVAHFLFASSERGRLGTFIFATVSFFVLLFTVTSIRSDAISALAVASILLGLFAALVFFSPKSSIFIAGISLFLFGIWQGIIHFFEISWAERLPISGSLNGLFQALVMPYFEINYENAYREIVVRIGVIGVVFTALILVLALSKGLFAIKLQSSCEITGQDENSQKTLQFASLAVLFTLVFQGLLTNIFNDMRLLFMFVVCVAFTVAAARSARENMPMFAYSAHSADIDLNL